jgi:hypothetical protein
MELSRLPSKVEELLSRNSATFITKPFAQNLDNLGLVSGTGQSWFGEWH